MKDKSKERLLGRKKRQKRVRKKIFGTSARPRLSIFRSSCHIYAQVIDDENQKTLASASTVSLKDLDGYSGNKKAASIVGEEIAKILLEKSINKVVFDRGGFVYHGRVKSLADAARNAGLKI